MLRYLALCLVLASAYGDPRAENELPKYAAKTRAVRAASKLLLKNLANLPNLTSVLDQSTQYYSLLYTVYKTADALACKPLFLTPKEALLNSLANDLPKALLDPKKAALELEETRAKSLKYLKPLLELVDKLCGDLGANDCDRVVDAAVKQDPKLQQLAKDLPKVSKAAKGLLAKEKRAQEVAASKDLVPYLRDNSKDVLDYAKDLAALLVLFKPCPLQHA